MLREQPEVNNNTASKREPTASEIRAQLERILGSQCFEQAGRSSKFLRFVAEQGLAGRGERPKGYTIAVEVFGRPPDFDAQNDPLVRVEAGRLRRRLAEYYAGEGKHDSLRADLPRGAYSVVWSYAPAESAPKVVVVPPPAPAAPPARVSGNRRRRKARAWLLAALLVAISGVVVVQQLELSRGNLAPALPPAALTEGKSPIVVQPFEDLSPQTTLRGLAEALTEETLLALEDPELFVIATETRAPPPQAGGRRVVAPETEGVEYVLSGSVREGADGVRITARVLAAGTGTQLWSAAFDESNAIKRSALEQERIARRIAIVAEPYGPIFDAEAERVQRLADSALQPRDCLVKYYDYRRRLDVAAHGATLACFERVTKAAKVSASAWAGLALALADGYTYGYGVLPAGDAAVLVRAREAARTAMDIDGDNVLANLALAEVQFLHGEDFRRAADRALALKPDRAQTLATLGTWYVFAGDTERGLAMVDRALELTPKPPGWIYATRALAALRLQHTDEAVAAALKIDVSNWALGQLVLASTAALAGRAELAARARSRLLSLDPRAAEALPALLERWRVDPAVRADLERGFAAAVARAQ